MKNQLKEIGFEFVEINNTIINNIYVLRVINSEKAQNFIKKLRFKSYLTVYAKTDVENNEIFTLSERSYHFAINYCNELREKKLKRILFLKQE
jgi:hypothetical protein